jgi:hypothetical protein
VFGINKDPKWNSLSWFQLQFGYDPKGPGLVIFPYNGLHKEWFDAGKHGAFFSTLHDSDNEVTIGILCFSGDFVDFHRLAEVFHLSYQGNRIIDGHALGTFKVGFKFGKSDFMGTPPKYDGKRETFQDANTSDCTLYRNNPYRPILVICHYDHRIACKDEFICQFNRNAHFMDRPGMYDFNFVSEQKFQNCGFKAKPPTKEELKTLLALRDAQLNVTGSLIVLNTGVVHNIDDALMVQAPSEIVPGLHVYAKSKKFKNKEPTTPTTLREILLSIPYPIFNSTDPKLPPSKHLFHSVDVNTGARDISYCSLIKFTCYRTRLPLGLCVYFGFTSIHQSLLW